MVKEFALICTVIILIAFFPSGSAASLAVEPERAKDADKLNIDGVVLLLDLLDTIVDKNPGYRDMLSGLKNLEVGEDQRLLEEKARANAADADINAKITVLFESAAYRLYHAKFRNVDQQTHSKIFCALPYQAIDSPAGIAHNLLELCEHRGAVRTWLEDIVSKIDAAKCRNIAAQWLPDGEYSIPATNFIYDGNGDAFVLFGSVCFDIFSIVVGKRPRETRFEKLSDVGVEEIERVLGHEYQHVFASPYLYPPGRSFATWQEKWQDRIVRQIVSEGVAMRCDLRPGMRREAMEDTVTVVYWIGQLNEKFAALNSGTIAEQELQVWYGASFHDTARDLLRDFLKRRYPDEDPSRMFRANVTARPSFIYTLGWWMISRILENEAGEAGKEGVIGLLSRPHDLFSMYNASLPDTSSPFHVIVEN